jgi:plastocyanin
MQKKYIALIAALSVLVLITVLMMIMSSASEDAANNTEDSVATEEVPEVEQVVCTADVKVCADGTNISRSGPACQFAECPGSVSAAPKEHVFDISGKNFAFSQTELKVQKGDSVTINFTSEEGLHDWVLDEFDVQTEAIKPGDSTSISFIASETGSFEYYCSVGSHRANGMTGNLIVE